MRHTMILLAPLLGLLILSSATAITNISADTNIWTCNGPQGTEIHALAIDPKTPTTVYTGTFGGAVYKSMDGGTNWAEAARLTSLAINFLVVDPAMPATAYAGTTDGGAFKTTNSGASWDAQNAGLTSSDISALTIDPTSPSKLYAGTIGGGVCSMQMGNAQAASSVLATQTPTRTLPSQRLTRTPTPLVPSTATPVVGPMSVPAATKTPTAFDICAPSDSSVPEFYLTRGAKYAENHDWECAFADYEYAIRLKPDYAEAFHRRGSLHLQYKRFPGEEDYSIDPSLYQDGEYTGRGDYSGEHGFAVSDLSEAIRLRPDYAEALVSRGAAYFVTGNLDGAMADWDRALQLKPTESQAHFFRGIGYMSQKEAQLDLARLDLTAAIEEKPDLAEAYLYRGEILDTQGDLGHAIADYDKFIELAPGDANAYFRRGDAYLGKGDLDFAIRDLELAVKLGLDEAGPERAYIYAVRGQIDQAVVVLEPGVAGTGNVARIVSTWDKAIQSDPNKPESYVARAVALLTLGSQSASDRALDDLDKAIQLRPDYADAYLIRAMALRTKKEFKDYVMPDLEQVVRLRPNDAPPYFYRAQEYAEGAEQYRNEKLAFADLDKALQLTSDYVEALAFRAELYSKNKDYDRALADYSRAIAIKPDWMAYYRRSEIHSQRGEIRLAFEDFYEAGLLNPSIIVIRVRLDRSFGTMVESAITEYEKEFKQKSADPLAYLRRGNAYILGGRVADAFADYDQAIKLDPTSAQAYYYRGFANEIIGEIQPAISDFQTVLRLSPSSNLAERSQLELLRLAHPQIK